MKKIYESPLNGYDEYAERIHVYALESDKEYWELDEMTFDEKCEYFDVYEEPDYSVMPGGVYHRYGFSLSGTHMVISETVALNV